MSSLTSFPRRLAAAIGDSLHRLGVLLTRPQTWAVLALLALFGFVIYLGVDFALRTDSLLHFLGYSGARCREPSEAGIFFLFCGAFFFALATVATFGEITQYLALRERNAHYETRQALKGALGWGGFALTLGLLSLYFLRSLCY